MNILKCLDLIGWLVSS